MLEGVYGCFMTCNVFLAGNSEVSLELQCFTAELITYIVCECDAPECLWVVTRQQPDLQGEEDCLLIRFMFPRDLMDSEVVWLILNYLDFELMQCIGRLRQPHMKGSLSERLKVTQRLSVKRLTVMLWVRIICMIKKKLTFIVLALHNWSYFVNKETFPVFVISLFGKSSRQS